MSDVLSVEVNFTDNWEQPVFYYSSEEEDDKPVPQKRKRRLIKSTRKERK